MFQVEVCKLLLYELLSGLGLSLIISRRLDDTCLQKESKPKIVEDEINDKAEDEIGPETSPKAQAGQDSRDQRCPNSLMAR